MKQPVLENLLEPRRRVVAAPDLRGESVSKHRHHVPLRRDHMCGQGFLIPLFTPLRREEDNVGQFARDQPRNLTSLVSPTKCEAPVAVEAVPANVAELSGSPRGARVEMMQWNHGIFDDASISVITTDTVSEIGRLAEMTVDIRRFRPNIVVRSTRAVPFGGR